MSRYDVIFVLPYPFSDHPSFPEGILKRTLESGGYTVGVIERPFWQKKESFSVLGKPELFFAVISGPVDSIVLNYTSSRKRRMEDQYQAGGRGFFDNYPPSIKYRIRPDNTSIVFSNRIKENYRDVPIILGGVEASLRQFAHYDFQRECVRRSILFDSRADLIVNGPGEKQILGIADRLRKGDDISGLELPGTSKIVKHISDKQGYEELPSLEAIIEDRKKLLSAFLIKEKGIGSGKRLCQQNGDRYIVSYPPEIYSGEDLDRYYSPDYSRTHSDSAGYSPALRMNLFSITSHRGCGGGCSFCSITLNEGKKIISRSPESVFREARALMKHREWTGVISDVGGPSAEMYGFGCSARGCMKQSCMFPGNCPSFRKGEQYRQLLRELRNMNGIKKILIGSGVRFDNLTGNPGLLSDIMTHHSGRFLRIAPEHTEDHMLDLMRKPRFGALVEFTQLVNEVNRKMKRKIGLAPYLIIGHPGETFKDVTEMKKKIRSLKLPPRDSQIFTPTPGTLSTAMYYSETAPDGSPLHVEKSIRELIRWKKFLSE